MSKGYKKGNGPGIENMHCQTCGKKRQGSLKLEDSFEGKDGDEAYFTCYQGHKTIFVFQKKNGTFKVRD